jgi:hypothetical protein
MNKEETAKKLEEAKKLPVATVEDLIRIPKGISEDLLNEYLKAFVKPSKTCWLCDESLYIQWGIAHGVANCVECGIDVRVYHFVKNEDGEEIRFEQSLQYHPNNYSV